MCFKDIAYVVKYTRIHCGTHSHIHRNSIFQRSINYDLFVLINIVTRIVYKNLVKNYVILLKKLVINNQNNIIYYVTKSKWKIHFFIYFGSCTLTSELSLISK